MSHNKPASDKNPVTSNKALFDQSAPGQRPGPETLAGQVLDGKRRAIARLITHLENEVPQAQTVLSELYPYTGQAHLIGVTGAPGTGKSSLVNELAKTFRRQKRTVAILAVDPTSPFSGGAILGDRIRMQSLIGDPGIFIRSMASRGNLGGLARATSDVVQVLDAAGFDMILIETVGAGQSEIEIAKTAHTIIVVEAPGLGDDIQAIKAGILEIADIFVVNKADRPGVNKTVAGLNAMLELGHAVSRQIIHHHTQLTVEAPLDTEAVGRDAWIIPIIKTMALKGEGIDQVVEAIDHHVHHLIETGELVARNRARVTDELTNRLQVVLMKQLLDHLPPDYLPEVIGKLVDRTLAPYNAIQKILEISTLNRRA